MGNQPVCISREGGGLIVDSTTAVRSASNRAIKNNRQARLFETFRRQEPLLHSHGVAGAHCSGERVRPPPYSAST